MILIRYKVRLETDGTVINAGNCFGTKLGPKKNNISKLKSRMILTFKVSPEKIMRHALILETDCVYTMGPRKMILYK